MWWFGKKKVINPIPSNACWGHLVSEHKVDVDTLYHKMRCVMKEDVLNGEKVTLLRIFDTSHVEKENVTVTGWETFDRHPELIAFEGYVTASNRAFLERRNF